MLALLALYCGTSCRSRGGDQATGLGCSLWSRRREAAAIALKMAIRMSIFIGRFAVSCCGQPFDAALKANYVPTMSK
jgi:hypothetical protein